MACINPVHIKSPYRDNKYIYVACGKCAWCQRDKRNEWYLRFKLEQRDCEFTKFITLTYSDDNLPFYLDEETGEYGFRAKKDDIQKFIKRMRKAGHKFKYFLVSEYAPQTKRPHYHALFFTDEDLTDEEIRKQWQLGLTDTQEADEGSLMYVTKYLLKGNERDGNFKLQSTRPAIGYGYIKSANAKQCYVKDNETGLFKFQLPINGQLLPMPRYYRKKFKQFFDKDEFELNTIRTINMMEKQGKFDFLEKKYFKLDDSKYDPISKQNHFETSLRNKYCRDVKKQYDINNKNFDDYAR